MFGETLVELRGIIALLLYLILVSLLLLSGILYKWPDCNLEDNPANTVAVKPANNPPGNTANNPPGNAANKPPDNAANKPPDNAANNPPGNTANNPPGNTANNPPDKEKKSCPRPASAELLLLVILAGALGSTAHAIRSLFWYIGNHELKQSWISMYLMLPFNGAVIALAFHFIVLGGFVSNLSGNDTWLGLIGIASMVGFFSQQATLKLKSIAEAIFMPSEKGEDHKSPIKNPNGSADTEASTPTLTSVTPPTGPLAGGQLVTLTGSGFVTDTKVSFGGESATEVKLDSATQLTAKAPAGKSAGKVDVEIANPNTKSSKLPAGYTYEADNASTPHVTDEAATTPATGEAAATPATDEAAATPTTDEAAATPTTDEAAATPTTDNTSDSTVTSNTSTSTTIDNKAQPDENP